MGTFCLAITHDEFVGKTGHFDNEIDLAGSESFEGMKVVIIKPKKTFSSSLSDKAFLCQPQACKNDVYLFPKELVEKVATLCLPALSMELTVLTQTQTDHTGVEG